MLWNAKNGEAVVGSTKMSYVSFGWGDRILILLPGLSDGLTTVKGKALLLAKPYKLFFEKYKVYMFSRKNIMPERYSIREMAADQALAMNALGIEKAAVMGVSQGGLIAQYLAIDYSNLVEKLVLTVTAPCLNDITDRCVRKWIDLAKQGKHASLLIDTAENSYSAVYLKKYRKIYPIIGLIGKPSAYNRFLINANAILHFDASDELYRINCPTFVIGGEDDKIVGAQASRDLEKYISGSELYMYPGLGHAAYEEAADFHQRVFTFLETSK